MKKGWEITRLGDVCEIIMGQSPDGESYNIAGEGIPLINGPVEFSSSSFGKTIRSKFTTQPTKLCRKDDLILCVRGSTTGRMNIAGFDACIGRGVAAIRAKQYQPWINHFIHFKRDEIHGKGTGATFPNVSGETLAHLELVFPPLPEQQRIVGVLDEAFAGLATAQANAEKNLQNARALFESHLQAVFTERSNEWGQQTTIAGLVNTGVLAAPIDGNHGELHPKKADFVASGVPFVMASDLESGGVNQVDCAFITRKQAGSLRKGFAVDGDVLLSHKGTIGRVAILKTNHEYVILTPQVTYYRVKAPEKLLNRFLYYALQAPDFVRAMSELAGAGSTRAYIGILKQQELPITIAAISEQRRLADQLDSLSAETQRLERIYREKLAALAALKKSLLHQAFSGEL